MVLVLTEDDVSKLANIDSVVATIENTLKEYSAKKTIMPQRQVMELPWSSGTIRLMPASIPSARSIGLKILTGSAGKRRKEGTYFLVSLFDEDGSIRCLLSANRLTQLRTGAASAVATKYLARKNSRTIGVIGAGVQGQGQLEAISRVATIKSGLVFDLVTESAEKMVIFAKEKLGIDLRVVKSIEEVSSQCDILVTTTTSKEPFLTEGIVKAGTHINAVGSNLPSRREVHENLLNQATVYVDSLEQAPKESGDLITPISTGKYASEKISGEIGEVIGGMKPGRKSDEQITIFKSVGIAVEDLATASIIFSEAVRRGMGQQIQFA